MCRKSSFLWIVSLLALIQAGSSHAEIIQRFTPARIGTHEGSLLDRIPCSDDVANDQQLTVFCQAEVNIDGGVSDAICRTIDQNHTSVTRMVRRNLADSTFLPATADGEAVKVFMSLRVAIAKEEGVCRFAAIPNWGYGTETYGASYSAPQEIIGPGGGWYNHGRILGPNAMRVGFNRRGLMFSMSAEVSTDGEASDARLEKNHFGHERLIQRSLNALEKAVFIPGFHNGEPVTMRYFEVLYIGRD